jgi:transcriptional regulator with XRE-family HTH domain/mannose-6-phosphate isomerase-like protein (cupin superfamily)
VNAVDRNGASVGERLRAERERRHVGLRELARRVNLSASLISQVELGRAMPSVSTLYAIVQELDISLDDLFVAAEDPEAGTGPESVAGAQEHEGPRTSAPGAPVAVIETEDLSGPPGPVIRAGDRPAMRLGSGVTWERMNQGTGDDVAFLHVVYAVGGASAPGGSLVRHGGREYGHVLEGRLGVTVGFETYELRPGDAVAFDSTTPHRLFNAGDAPARAVWFVVGDEERPLGGGRRPAAPSLPGG